MTKVLVTFGDSWPAGAELRDTGLRYGEIIRDSMGFDQFYNYGMGGASNEDMMLQFQQHLREVYKPEHKTTAIFFLTNPGRTVHWPRFMSNITSDPEFQKLILHMFSEEMITLRYNATVTTLQTWCNNFNIDYWWFAGWVRYNVWYPGVNLDRIWAQGKETAADWFGATRHNGEHLLEVENNPYIRPNFCHPNRLGHELIAEKLMAWMKGAGIL